MPFTYIFARGPAVPGGEPSNSRSSLAELSLDFVLSARAKIKKGTRVLHAVPRYVALLRCCSSANAANNQPRLTRVVSIFGPAQAVEPLSPWGVGHSHATHNADRYSFNRADSHLMLEVVLQSAIFESRHRVELARYLDLQI